MKLPGPTAWAVFHAAMTTIWALLLIPSLLWWHDSVLWVVVMSLWANIASHWSGFQASMADRRIKKQADGDAHP